VAGIVNTNQMWQRCYEIAAKIGIDVRLLAYTLYCMMCSYITAVSAYLRYSANSYLIPINGDNQCQRLYDLEYDRQVAIVKKDFKAVGIIEDELSAIWSGKYGLTKVEKPLSNVDGQKIYNKLLSLEKNRIEYTRASDKNIAIVAVTDLHCNSQFYPKIKEEIEFLNKHRHDEIILIINGDIVTKCFKREGREKWVDAKGSDSHENRLKQLEQMVADVLVYQKVQVIFNVGNHEIMHGHPHSVARFYNNLKKRFGNRVHVVSNLKPKKSHKTKYLDEPENGFVNIITPSVNIEGIPILGYCTAGIIPEVNPSDKEKYEYAIRHYFIDIDDGIGEDKKTKHINRLLKYIPQRGVFIVLAHEGQRRFSTDVGSLIYMNKSQMRLLIGGHSHEESESFVPGFDVALWPKPFGQGAVIIKFGPYSQCPTYGTAEWCNYKNWDKPHHYIRYRDLGKVQNKYWTAFASAGG
jgi:Icc-related predicted phosphoesterase